MRGEMKIVVNQFQDFRVARAVGCLRPGGRHNTKRNYGGRRYVSQSYHHPAFSSPR
jgi:hypothetical protein